MDILIFTRESDRSSAFEDVKDYFSQEFKDKEFEWKCTGQMLSASLQISEEEITAAFRELVKRYPQLDVKAVSSRDIREDDRSAQWWQTTEIYSVGENGEKKIVSSSSTYWN